MKRLIRKKALPALLALAMVFSMFAAMPLTARAQNAMQLAATIIEFAHGGDGALAARVVGSTVEVTGTVTGVTNTLSLNIDANTIVLWKADYSGRARLIELTGRGIFEIPEGGSLEVTEMDSLNYCIYIPGGEPIVEVTGGSLSTVDAAVICSISGDAEINVNSGTVSTFGGFGIYFRAQTVVVRGGTVSSEKSNAIYNENALVAGAGSLVVSGGTVVSYGKSAISSGYNTPSPIKITGGCVFGRATVITGDDVNNAVVHMPAGHTPTITAPAAICGWDSNIDTLSVAAGSSANLATNDGTTAKWDQVDGKPGVALSNGSNKGFIPVETVNLTGMTSPTIHGESSFTITEGYAALSAADTAADIGQFTATGAPTPVIRIESGNAAITIDEDGYLSIAAGLEAGTYPVVLKASNGVSPDATLTFTLTVEEDEELVAPKITGPEAMTLEEGYAKTSSAAFTIDGPNEPVVTIISGNEKITWNEGTNKLDIADGLAAGTYIVKLKVSNGVVPDAEHTFTLTVTAAAGSMDNFKKSNTYTRGLFPDVDETQWYGFDEQKTIALAYEYGLMQGNADGTFNPGGNVTIAQAVAVAARVHVLYSGAEKLIEEEPWFEVYVAYAIANRMIKATDFADYGRPATRAEMVYIFASALPEDEFPAISTVKSLPDVDNATPYSEQIFMMYEAGILMGNDDDGTFTPNANISRAQAAAIISRVILPATRAKGKVYPPSAQGEIAPAFAKYDSAENFSEGFARVKLNDLFGFIDKTGKLVVPIMYEAARSFHEGMAWVALDGKGGFIDTTGTLVVPLKYEGSRDFHEGLARVTLDGKRGFVDKTGIEIAPVYDNAADYSDGMSAVQKDGKWGAIDSSGNVVVEIKYDGIQDFREGMAWVELDGKRGFVDTTGTFVTAIIYEDASSFFEGLARVTLDGKRGFIDKTGTEIVPPMYEDAESFIEGMSRVMLGGSWGFIDASGTEVVPPTYSGANAFHEGLARIVLDNKCGFIDKTGAEVVPPIYQNSGNFCEGMARVRLDGKWGFIDKTGAVAGEIKYDEVVDFCEGMAQVRLGEKWGFIDKTGAVAGEIKYDEVFDFCEGMAIVTLDKKIGFIDSTGKEAVPLKYNGALDFQEGLARVTLNGKRGFVDKSGKEITPTFYDNADAFFEGLARVLIGEKWGFIDSTGKEIP